ncbi:hypothetical protein HQ590_05735, partial [bacterium]|nr:hypothetical protein [bacterium]
NSNGQSFDSTNKQYSARFRALASATVDRVYQRYVSVDSNTTVQVGIMADDGNGNPSGTFLAATPADLEPAEGMSWAVFTNAVTLQPLQVYHVVTRVTALETGAVFYVRCSGANSVIRPYDRATDTYLNGMNSSDGGQTWGFVGADPFFTLGYGSNVVAGVGNAEQSSHPTALLTQGGTGKAVGQRFTVTTREVPAGSLVLVNDLTFSIANVNATHDLILRLRRGDGTVLGTITRPAGDIAATITSYTWPFDGGALVRLLPGEPYYLTTELAAGSGTDEYYYFSSIYGDAVSKANTWGGTNACAPIQSGTANNWTGFNWSAPPPYAGRDQFDLWFNTSAQVLDQAYDTLGHGISDLWRQWYFGGDGTSTNNVSCASCDPDGDGILNRREYLDGTDPTSSSLFRITALTLESNDVRVFWLIGGGQTAVVQAAESVHGPYTDISPSIIAVGPGNVITNHLELGGASLGQQRFYRIRRVP